MWSSETGAVAQSGVSPITQTLLPGDFDEEFGELDPAVVQVVQPSRERQLTVQFALEGDDAMALQRIADGPGEVVRSLIRAASAKAA
ncbi:MAG TPA: hypothetical protein VGG98_04895 [Solirubrobacteraceae bacterium]|jgi:hypothetical protein